MREQDGKEKERAHRVPLDEQSQELCEPVSSSQSHGRVPDDLFENVRPIVQKVIRRRLSNAEDQEDCTQDVLIELFKALQKGTYRPDRGAFLPWVSGIADHVAKDAASALAIRMRRAEGRGRQSRPGGPFEDIVGRLDDEDEKRFWRSLLDFGFAELMRTVPARDLEVFLLRRLVGRKAKEIAEMYHLAPASVRSIDRRVFLVLCRSLGYRAGPEAASE